MIIQPQGQIRVLKNIPLDPVYRNSILFASRQAQTTYFLSHSKRQFDDVSYTREGVARVGCIADDIFDCNYMMYQNTGFSDKWFYAFIDEIRYINNGCAEIVFHLDVMQTWLYGSDWGLGQCYVLRQHTGTDGLWSHRCPEPIPLGDTVFSQTVRLYDGSDVNYIVFSKIKLDGDKVKGVSFANGQVIGSYAYKRTSKSAVDTIVQALQARQDEAIEGIQVIPKIWGDSLETDSDGLITTNAYQTKFSQDVSFSIGFDGWTPRNNKCYNFPYFCVVAGDGQGGMAEFAFEDIGGSSFTIDCYGEVALNAGTTLHIRGYKGLPNNNHSYDFSCGTYPQAQYASASSVAFQQEQMATRMSASLASMNQSMSTVNTATSLGGQILDRGLQPDAIMQTAQAIGGLIAGSTVTEVTNDMNMDFLLARQANTPSVVHNTSGNSNIALKNGALSPFLAVRHMPISLMRYIDDFFTVFGYQINRLQQPNIDARPKFTYVKTQNCVVTGTAPVNARQEIANAFNAGITWWKNGVTVGDYSVDNK